MTPDTAKYVEALSNCVRCGGCKAVCPTFAAEALEPLGARGRLMILRALAVGELAATPLVNERIFSCILCGACSGVCPLGVDIQEAVYHGRSILSRSDSKRKLLRMLLKRAVNWPELAFRAARLAKGLILPALAERGMIPEGFRLPDSPLRKSEQVFKTHRKKDRVAVFAGCSTNYGFPHLGESLINVLRKFGYEVVLPKGEVCCGNPLRSLGLHAEAEALAKKNHRVFSRLKVEAVLSLCPTCTTMIKNEYPKLIGRGIEKAMDISEFFRDRIGPAGHIGTKVYYHDPCHSAYGLGIRKEPRDIIKKAGLDLVGSQTPSCCGFGGVFRLSFREMSDGLLAECSSKIKGSGADAVVTSCPGCILQLSGAISDRPVLHLIEVIEEAYCFRQEETVEA